jgi:hypothetical protein
LLDVRFADARGRTAMGFMDTIRGWFGSTNDAGSDEGDKADTYVDRARDFSSDAEAKGKDTSQDMYDSAKDKVSDIGDDAGKAVDEASDAVSDAAGDAIDAAGDVVDDAKDQFS